MLLTWILLTTLAVAIPTGEAGIQSLAKALLRQDQLPQEFQEKVSHDYQCLQWCTVCHDYALFTQAHCLACHAYRRTDKSCRNCPAGVKKNIQLTIDKA